MEQITVPSFRIALKKGKAVPGKPDLLIGQQIGTSLYTWNRIYEVKHIKNGTSSCQGQQQEEEDAGLAIKVCWQPAGIALGMSLRALEHEWLMYQNIEVFCQKHPELAQYLLHAHAAIFTSATSNTLGCCCIGKHAAAAELSRSSSHSSSSDGSRGGGRNTPGLRQVSPTEAADTIFNTDKPKSITAIMVDRAHGKTVQQRIKQKDFNDITYVAEVILQLVPVLATLQRELGFNHDDLRLDNILETWQQQQGQRQQQQQGQKAVPSNAAHGSNHRGIGGSGSNSSSGGSGSAVTFKLFDLGLSMVNPDRFSMGEQANGTPKEKQEALKRLREQGYVFHKALGMVSLFHVFQFGRAADIYRLCQSLSKHLSGRTWPDADKALVTACFKLLSAISCKTLTASFTDRGSQQQQQQQQQGRQTGSDSSSGGGGSQDGVANAHAAPIPDTTTTSSIGVVPLQLQPGVYTSNTTGGIQGFLKQQQQARQLEMQQLPMQAGAPAGADMHSYGYNTGSYGSSRHVNGPPYHTALMQHNATDSSNAGATGHTAAKTGRYAGAQGGSSGSGSGRKPAGNRFDDTPTHSIGSVVTLKFKPSGTPPTAAESGRPKALQWVQGFKHRRQQSKQARAITAQQMEELPLFQDLQAAMREHRGNAHG